MSDDNPLGEQWRTAQRHFVDAWSQMSSLGPAAGSSGQANLWADGFERWRKTAGGETQPEIRSVIDKCVSMGKGYFALAEQLGIKLDEDASPVDGVSQWLEQLSSSMRQVSKAPNFDSSKIGDLLHPWFNPADSWQQFASDMTLGNPSTQQMLGLPAGVSNFDDAIESLGKLLDTPAVGPTRESLEKRQQAARLALDYQQANQQFNRALLRVATESVDSFREQLAVPANAARLDSLRGVYDLWVEVSEQGYGEFAISQEYQRLYGDRVNRLMALRIHLNRLTDDLMGEMNLPRGREFDTMQQRLQQLKRDNLEMKQAVSEIRAALDSPPSTTNAATSPVKAVRRKASAKKVKPKQSAPKKASPKKASPKKAAPKKGPLKNNTQAKPRQKAGRKKT